MMRFSAILGVWLAAFPPAQDPEHTLKFKYAEGDREKFVMSVQMRMEVGVYAGMESFEQKIEGPVSFSLATTCKGAAGGKADFEGEMGDMELTQNLVINGDAFKFQIKGRQVRLENGDGEAMVDTEGGINPEQAEALLAEFKSFGEKVVFTMSERGLVKGLKEDSRLKEFFGGMGGENLYPVVLPEEPVKIGAEWTYTTHLKELGKMKIAGNGLSVPVRYKLERVESSGGRRVAIVTARQDASFKDLEVEGGIEGMPEGTKIRIKSLAANGSGETRFDIGWGRIVTSEFQARAKAEMKFKPEGMDEMEAVVDVTLKAKAEPK
jgi:hypothetical protein